jgi:hypothetical protein
MWTGRQTDKMKLIVAFSNFANMPKNCRNLLSIILNFKNWQSHVLQIFQFLRGSLLSKVVIAT